MNSSRFTRRAARLVGTAALALAAHVCADTYDLSWHTIDGGGTTSSGGSYSITGTIGQADAGVMNGGGYSLSGGFWTAAGGPVFICAGDTVTSETFAPPPDGKVDAADLAFLLSAWGANPGSPADLVTSATFQPPPDGIVDAADLATLLGEWGVCSR